MQPRIQESDVEEMSGTVDVDTVQSTFYQDYVSMRDAKDNIPDWLKEQNPDDYEDRLHHHTYHEHVQGEMAAWLSHVDGDSVSADKVESKYKEFKREFRSDHRHIQLDSW